MRQCRLFRFNFNGDLSKRSKPMTKNEKQMEKTNDPNHKTPYSHPQLVVYGDIQEITLARREGEASDNPAPGSNLTMTGFSQGTPKPTDPKKSASQG
jgi:hypothetical protein